jgi:hypothetical protein
MFPALLEKPVSEVETEIETEVENEKRGLKPKPLWFTIAIVLFASPIMTLKVWYEGWNPLKDTLPGVWGRIVFTAYLVILCALLLRRGWHKNRRFNP